MRDARRDGAEIPWYNPDMTMRAPRFALFGEDSRKSSDEIVHCETIEARSRRYDWEIGPHRHPALYQLLLVRGGRARIFLNDDWFEPSVPALIVTPPGRIHGFSFSRDVDGHVLTLSLRFLAKFDAGDAAGTVLARAAIHRLDEGLAGRLAQLADQIVTMRQHGEAPDMLRSALAEAFVRALAVEVAHTKLSRDDDIVRRFQILALEHAHEQRRLDFYADTIGCTERTLTRHVRDALDIAPMQYLHERLASEATRLLRFTNATCADVAEELGFADPSYFSRFYLRMTGERPGAVRGSTSGE